MKRNLVKDDNKMQLRLLDDLKKIFQEWKLDINVMFLKKNFNKKRIRDKIELYIKLNTLTL